MSEAMKLWVLASRPKTLSAAIAPVLVGTGAGRAEYVAMLAVAFAAPIVLWASGLAGPACLVALASFALAARPLYRVFNQSGRELNPALGETARLQIVYALLLGGGLLFS